MRCWWVLLWISLVKRERKVVYSYTEPLPWLFGENIEGFGSEGMWFCTSGGAWSTPSSCLLVFCLMRRVPSGTRTPQFWARPRGMQVRRGDAFTFGRSPVCGMGEELGQLLELLLTPDTLLEVDLRNQEKLWQTLLFIFGIFSLVFQGNEAAWTHCEFTPLPHQDRFKQLAGFPPHLMTQKRSQRLRGSQKLCKRASG